MEYTPMRRKDRALTAEDAMDTLRTGQYGILSTVGPEGLPYGTPLSYVLDNGDIIFHCARTGHKITNINHQPGVCFTVVDNNSVGPVYHGGFSTYFRSAVAFGTAVHIDDNAEKSRLLWLLCEKYLPAHMDKADGDIAKALHATDVWRIRIDHLTGKAKR